MIRDITALKQQAASVSRNLEDVNRLKEETANLEEELRTSGSTRTADDVQAELDTLSGEM